MTNKKIIILASAIIGFELSIFVYLLIFIDFTFEKYGLTIIGLLCVFIAMFILIIDRIKKIKNS